MKIVSAGDANRHFSSMLRDVAMGEVITVLSRGKAVATITPARQEVNQRQSARRALLQRLGQQNTPGERNWTRNELYES
jgi:antitoxin (DNA-binding transcriptional repressor) of toxin-antitoxin stability system